MTHTPKVALDPGNTLTGNVVILYAAVGTTEPQEGRGPNVVVSYHLDRTSALAATVGIGVQGTNGKAEEVLALSCEINGIYHYYLLPIPIEVVTTDDHVRELRERTLASLSPAQRAVIGYPDGRLTR